MNTLYRHIRDSLLAALCGGLLFSTLACGSQATVRGTRRHYPKIAGAASVKCFIEPVPEKGYKVLAVIDTDSVSTVTVAGREQMLKQLREQASLAGAERVYDLHLLTRQTKGHVHDPNAPKWAPAVVPGWTDTYFLRGKAVIAEGSIPERFSQFQSNPKQPAPPADQGGKTVSLDPPPSPNADPVEAMDNPTWVNLLSTSRYW